MKLKILFASLLTATFLFAISCKHTPFPLPEDPNAIDTVPHTTGIPCNPDSVYFSQQVLPIFKNNCAMSGCHDAASHKEGYVLDSYANIMGSDEITPYKPNKGDIMEKIHDGEMPPSPYNLTAEQIDLIEKWITQGCKNLLCDELCDTSNVTYSGTIAPLLEMNCINCHKASVQSGGIRLDGYNYVYPLAISDTLFKSMNFESGFTGMPYNGQKLSDCKLDEIKIWVNDGAPDN